ncbi:hypothetical protein PBT90_05560 [Algoriphagus halophytocola]|uniref:DUF3325 domain-containing protein n=1 Tax=Algoriphagus halophytocola TaxID=2991499 RepID=A0ABY6ML01_9BACT|nr:MULTISPECIES: hypothetical protein [unclassified Algoriphagus]UZD22884.1 hypothetical protein OM944_00015 [Algoriphagus sp. TR-M5]WBL44151.1 hypothetical protein PBT90_05560 [Algoriphagus sp. TR-M9]
MISLIILLTWIGFEFFYQTSKKAELHSPEWLATWFGANEVRAKIYGAILLGVSLVLSIIQLGLGSGFFAFLCILMLIGSLVVLISPLRKVKLSWVMAGIGVLFLIEIL